MPIPPEVAAVLAGLALPAPAIACRPLAGGHINRSFLVELAAPPWGLVLQRINPGVFPEPVRIMANLRLLADHLAAKGLPPAQRWQVPALIPAAGGADYLCTADGALWRALVQIPDAGHRERLTSSQEAREVGACLGRFHVWLADLDPRLLADPLPGFHDTPRYLADCEAVLAAHPAPLSAEEAWCQAFIARRRHRVGRLEEARRRGDMPVRLRHGDPKLANILFDRQGRALALIDLDTVGPGLLIHDVADCLRSACNQAGEGAAAGEVSFDLGIAAPILEGYFAEASGLWADQERQLLGSAVGLMALELGMRFFADHLAGDCYFRVCHAGANLRRARAQLELAASIEAQEEALSRLGQTAG
ncbi:MAG: aminoglycoside phosphotransferase family protein [Thermodesulfobacteriota bacterium]